MNERDAEVFSLAREIADFQGYGIPRSLQATVGRLRVIFAEIDTEAENLGKPPHRRSPERDYDPTPICLHCGLAWDETGSYWPDARCPESPGAYGWKCQVHGRFDDKSEYLIHWYEQHEGEQFVDPGR